jgi:hypothetical protein
MAEVGRNAYATTGANAAAGTPTVVAVVNDGTGDRQIMAIGAGDGTTSVVSVSAGALSVSQTDLAGTGNITTQNLNPNSGTATAASVLVLTGPMTGISTVSIQVTGTYTGALTPQCSLDNNNWIAMGSTALINVSTNVYSGTVPSAAQQIYQADIAGFPYFRMSANAAVTGTAVVTLRATNATGMVGIDNPLPSGTNTIGAINIAATQTLATVTTVGTLTTITNGVKSATSTTGGATTFTQISAATTNAAFVKASAGTLYGVQASNTGAAVAFLKIFNKASAPTVGTDVAVKTYIIPSGGGTNIPIPPQGLAFGTGIAISITGLATTADTTAVALAQVVVNIDYA